VLTVVVVIVMMVVMPAILVGAGRGWRSIVGPIAVAITGRRRGRRNIVVGSLLHDAPLIAVGIMAIRVSVGAGLGRPAELVADQRPADGTDNGTVAAMSVTGDCVSEQGTAQRTDQRPGDLLVMPVPFTGIAGRGKGGCQRNDG
jgi:hypothetical protein